jgi:ABC-2 type transport system permease protein
MLRLVLLETRQLARERFTWVLLLFLVLACALAVANGRALMTAQVEGRAAAVKGDTSRLERIEANLQPDADRAMAVLIPYWVQQQVVSPPPPLADFSAGRAPYEPHATTVTLRSREDTLFERTAVDNPEATARGALDLTFVAVVLAPLALIALGYGLFSADRESGAARLLLAQGGTPTRVLLARSVPRLLLVLTPLALSAAVFLATGPELEGRAAAAAWWLLIALALALFWWAVILLVNALRVGAETAALALVSVWALLTLVLPAAITAAAQIAYPPPSRFEQIATARAAEVASTTAYENDHPDLASEGFEGRLASIRKSLSVGRTVDRAVDPIARRFETQLGGQQEVVRLAAWASPPMVAADAMTATAGTDVGRALAFRQAAADHVTRLKASLGGFIDRGGVMTPAEYQALPNFEWRAEPTRPALQAAVLLLLAAVLSVVALRRLARTPV